VPAKGPGNCAAQGPPSHCLDEPVATEGIAGYLHPALGEALAAADVMRPVGEQWEQVVSMVIALGRPQTLGRRLRSTAIGELARLGFCPWLGVHRPITVWNSMSAPPAAPPPTSASAGASGWPDRLARRRRAQ
jgi:hypothetical protein